MIYLIATLKVKPGALSDIMPLVQPCIDATRKEAGCISYDLHQSVTDPDTLVFVERWKDQAAIDSHFEEPHLKAWAQAGAPYVVERKIEIISPDSVIAR